MTSQKPNHAWGMLVLNLVSMFKGHSKLTISTKINIIQEFILKISSGGGVPPLSSCQCIWKYIVWTRVNWSIWGGVPHPLHPWYTLTDCDYGLWYKLSGYKVCHFKSRVSCGLWQKPKWSILGKHKNKAEEKSNLSQVLQRGTKCTTMDQLRTYIIYSKGLNFGSTASNKLCNKVAHPESILGHISDGIFVRDTVYCWSWPPIHFKSANGEPLKNISHFTPYSSY